MEKIVFNILMHSDHMCRIVARDIRTDIRKLSDGGCISSYDVLISEMNHITNKASDMGYEAVFKLEKMY